MINLFYVTQSLIVKLIVLLRYNACERHLKTSEWCCQCVSVGIQHVAILGTIVVDQFRDGACGFIHCPDRHPSLFLRRLGFDEGHIV